MSALIEEGKCDVETSKKKCTVNKAVTLIKKIENYKSFIGVSILFVCISVITKRIIICLCLKSRKNNVLPFSFFFRI